MGKFKITTTISSLIIITVLLYIYNLLKKVMSVGI